MSYEICPHCGAKKPVSPNISRDKIIREKYAECMTLSQLSALNLIGEARIKQIIGKENLRYEDTGGPRKEFFKRRDTEIYDLYKYGLSSTVISCWYQLSRARIHQIVMRKLYRERREAYKKRNLTPSLESFL